MADNLMNPDNTIISNDDLLNKGCTINKKILDKNRSNIEAINAMKMILIKGGELIDPNINKDVIMGNLNNYTLDIIIKDGKEVIVIKDDNGSIILKTSNDSFKTKCIATTRQFLESIRLEMKVIQILDKAMKNDPNLSNDKAMVLVGEYLIKITKTFTSNKILMPDNTDVRDILDKYLELIKKEYRLSKERIKNNSN